MSQRISEIQVAMTGTIEDIKGKVKEVIGVVINRDDLRREGRAQQDKASAQRDAAKKEVEANSARAAAKANEKRQAAKQK
ncbi:MAG: CsbD family protein [Mycolicibacterium sp.]|nr:CsbD family protein [Mycolicibacterium sp.]